MRFIRLALAAATLVLVFACTPAFAGSHATGKAVIRMDLKGAPNGTGGWDGAFTLKSRTADRGSDYFVFSGESGQVTLTGRKGSVVLRLKPRPSGLHVDSEGLDLWTGTWSIVSGTGAYANLKGLGAYVGIIGPNYLVAFHLEGFVHAG